jgi:hypothetical protein
MNQRLRMRWEALRASFRGAITLRNTFMKISQRGNGATFLVVDVQVTTSQLGSGAVTTHLVSAVLAFLLIPQAGVVAGTVRIAPLPELGIQTLHFEGRIEKGDLKRIRDLVPKAKSLNPENQVYVSWHSPGGDLGEGIEIGRYLREQGIGTIVPPSGICASACVIAFWGGFDSEKRKVRRIAMTGARLAVHRAVLRDPSLTRKVKADPNAVVEALQRHLAVTIDYLQAMEVSLEVQKRQFGTSNQEVYILKEPELEGSGVLLARRSSSGWTLRNPQAPAELGAPDDSVRAAAQAPCAANHSFRAADGSFFTADDSLSAAGAWQAGGSARSAVRGEEFRSGCRCGSAERTSRSRLLDLRDAQWRRMPRRGRERVPDREPGPERQPVLRQARGGRQRGLQPGHFPGAPCASASKPDHPHPTDRGPAGRGKPLRPSASPAGMGAPAAAGAFLPDEVERPAGVR